jgi:hypothetical protein
MYVSSLGLMYVNTNLKAKLIVLCTSMLIFRNYLYTTAWYGTHAIVKKVFKTTLSGCETGSWWHISVVPYIHVYVGFGD